MSPASYVLAALAAALAGAVNALAGGGTLITFPALVALGIPPLSANVTNTVALCPGYLGGAVAQAGDLAGTRRRLAAFVPAGILGGLAGGWLLLRSGERLFSELVPFLIFGAALLLALQDRVRAALLGRAVGRDAGAKGGSAEHAGIAIAGILIASVYGGYFGAGLSVILLAVLGLAIADSLTRLNAQKQVIALAVNVSAAIFFVASGRVVWPVALVMAGGALAGGAAGGRLAGRVKPATLRRTVVAIGVGVAIIYWMK